MGSRSCRFYRPLLSAYLDGELSDEERQRLFAHLAICPDCQRRLQEYQSLRERLRRLPPTPPPPRQLQRQLWQRLAETEREQRRSHRFRLAVTTTALSVVIVLALVLSASIGLQRTQPPRILESRPAAGTTQRWPIYQPVELVFSKPMNKQSVMQNLRISPPGERERLPISWEGTKLIIGADSERRVALLPDTVYHIAILPNAEDRWGHRLGLTYTLTFRTSSAIVHATETPGLTPVAPQPGPSPTPSAPAITESNPTPQTASTPVSSVPPPSPAPSSNSSQPSASPPPAPQPAPTAVAVASPTPTPLPTPTPVPPTPAPEPTPTPTLSPTPATPEPIPVTGAFGRIFWADQAVQKKLGAPVSPALVVNAAELAFQRGFMVERFDTLTVYVLEATGTWKSVPEPAPVDPPLEFRSVEPNLWLPGGTFGQVWEALTLADSLGYATESEIHVMATGARIQNFEHGTMIQSDRGFVYVLFDDGTWAQFPVTS